MTGEVLQFPGPKPDKPKAKRRTPRSDWEKFRETIFLQEDSGKVERAFHKLLGTNAFSANRIAVLTPLVERSVHPTGALAFDPKRGDVLCTNERFPALLEEAGLKPSVALKVAANSVLSIIAVERWRREVRYHRERLFNETIQKRSLQPTHREFWPDNAFSLQTHTQLPVTAIYRMAAAVAIEASPDFAIMSAPPYPFHIAALADPLNKTQVRQLFSAGTSHVF